MLLMKGWDLNYKLSACPFCGQESGEWVLMAKNEDGKYAATCLVCETVGPVGETPEFSFCAWNKRKG